MAGKKADDAQDGRQDVTHESVWQRMERPARPEQPPRIEAGHPAVAARDHVETVDEEVRVNGGAHGLPRTRADEQRAHRITASFIGPRGPHLARRPTRHPPDETSWGDRSGRVGPTPADVVPEVARDLGPYTGC